MNVNALDLSHAVLLYLHAEDSAWPESDRNIVTYKYGENTGKNILDKVDAILKDMEAIAKTINWNECSEVASAKIVRDGLLVRYPYLSARALDALAWAFSYWWK